MRLQRIQELVFHRPWLITPTGHASVRALLEHKLASYDDPEPRAGFLDDLIIPRPAASIDADKIGHAHITGVIGVGLSKLEKTCGNTDTADLLAELDTLRAGGAEKIMLHVDSPGGTVGGVAEASEAIGKSNVPVFAYVGAGQMACSAAYWLISGTDRIYASATAEVGSIGVYLPWIDQTAAAEMRGLKVELIKNKEGDLKAAGYPGTALTDVQREDLQEGVQQVFDAFAADVLAGRGRVSADTMRGQSFWGRDAKSRNLTDGVVSYEAALRTLMRYRRD